MSVYRNAFQLAWRLPLNAVESTPSSAIHISLEVIPSEISDICFQADIAWFMLDVSVFGNGVPCCILDSMQCKCSASEPKAHTEFQATAWLQTCGVSGQNWPLLDVASCKVDLLSN